MEFNERLKSLRNNLSMTQKDISKLLGVSEVSIRCWENGSKNPSMDYIIALSSLFKVSSDYLLGVKTDIQKDSSLLDKNEKNLISNYRELDRYGKIVVETVCDIEKSRVESQLSFSKSNRYIPKYSSLFTGGTNFEMILIDDSVPADADFAIVIQGNSMCPHIKDGDTVYVKKDCNLSTGDVGVFSVDGVIYCKQYYIDNDNTLNLVSANPNFRDTNICLKTKSDTDVKCFGRVLLSSKISLPNYLLK